MISFFSKFISILVALMLLPDISTIVLFYYKNADGIIVEQLG
jgi:hypothetical protein